MVQTTTGINVFSDMNTWIDFVIIPCKSKDFTKAEEIISTKTNEQLEVANTNDELLIKFERAPKNYKFALARTKEIKNDDTTS